MSSGVAASVQARLLSRAKAEREEFERMLVRYADERFLYRLGLSPVRERCILKGASLLALWLGDPYRATRDVDLLAFGPSNDEAIRAIIQEICAVPCPEDGLRFDLDTLRMADIGGADEYLGTRARLVALLGSARIAVQIDFGFGDALVEGPEEIEYPTLLDSLPAPRLRAYSRDASMAEKFEAMVSLDVRNSRMKDFHDVWALSNVFRFDGPSLQAAVAACFERRRTPWPAALPGVLTPAFYRAPEMESRWRRYLAAGGILVRPPNQFEAIGERISQLFGPIRECILVGALLNRTWEAGGPWR
ncbi:MAG: nucleotidyl transferase AbiEii/AbiGii toxin family protein [Gemmatimonadaceae bacterium]